LLSPTTVGEHRQMPTAWFALDPGGPKRLEVRWAGAWKDVAIHLDGAPIGAIPSKAELQEGRSFTLPDRSILHVKLVRSFADIELQVTRNGAPLPGSATDPAERVRLAGSITLFIAVCSGLSGLMAAVFQVKSLTRLGLGWPSVVEGAVLGVLGIFTLRRSKAALILAITVFAIEGIAVLTLRAGGSGPPPLGLLIRFVLLLPMIRGISAIDELNTRSAMKP
jgi:hypothetical protein